MAVIVLASASGAPGVTTTSVGLASVWPRPVLLVDADPTGGSAILAGFFQGNVAASGGLSEVVLGSRRGDLAGAIAASAVALPGTAAHVLPGVSGHVVARTMTDVYGAAGELRALAATGRTSWSMRPALSARRAVDLRGGRGGAGDRFVVECIGGGPVMGGTWRATFEDIGAGSTTPAVLVIGPGRPYGVRRSGRC